MRAIVKALLLVLVGVWVPSAALGEPRPLKVFILAGQSNMVGFSVVDLAGKDFNDGKGTLAQLVKDPAKRELFRGLLDDKGGWRTRDDVWVRYVPEDQKPRVGSLGFGFTSHDGKHHFGPELGFGQVVGDALDDEVLVIKTAWGGKSLYVDFRPPSSGGQTGKYYTQMIKEVREALAAIKQDFPNSKAQGYELAGFVWYQGWNDGCDPDHAVPEYEANLVNLIKDVRKDLNAPRLPVVVGELTGPWVKATNEWDRLRKAQEAATTHPEFAGNVVFVPTHDFVRKPEDSPNPGHGHHEFGNAETGYLVGAALGNGMLSLIQPGRNPAGPALAPAPPAAPKPAAVQKAEEAGYMLVPVERVPPEFNAGFSLYAAAWPLVETYPGHRFQTGLFGTWMHAQYEGEAPKKAYSDIEGGLGWWRSTRFPTTTPKFIMGGVAVEFGEIANGPASGIGTWEKPKGLYGVAQLSPRLLFPLDGLNLKQGTCGQLFGYGYLTLPLTEPKAKTAGEDVPTGCNCWTLFLNTANFKGPVCFFTPVFFSRSTIERRDLSGKMLDTRPCDPNKAFQMETQYVPAAIGEADGTTFARVAPMSFPANAGDNSVVLHRLTGYSKAAVWDAVNAWFEGGAAPSGAVNPAGEHVQTFKDGGGSTWAIYPDGKEPNHGDKEKLWGIDWRSFGTPAALSPTEYGYRWKSPVVGRAGEGADARVTLPRQFKLVEEKGKRRWVPVAESDVPAETGLALKKFDRPREPAPEALETDERAAGPFKKPGPVAGPFKAHLGDGSVVTYCWYRFADQPALLRADLTDAEREALQLKVEKIHRAWTIDRDYLAPPAVGALADLDPAQIVTPPKGLEVGYVPIAVRQELAVPTESTVR